MKRPGKRPVCTCGGGYVRIENAQFPLPDGRPQFRCTKCGETWTEGHSGGESLKALTEGTP